VRGQRHAPAAFTPGKEPVPIVQEAEWAPGPVWTGVENLAPTGVRSPDRPASLYADSATPAHTNFKEYPILYHKHSTCSVSLVSILKEILPKGYITKTSKTGSQMKYI